MGSTLDGGTGKFFPVEPSEERLSEEGEEAGKAGGRASQQECRGWGGYCWPDGAGEVRIVDFE